MCGCFFFFKQKTAYEMRISDWSSDVCSSDLLWSLNKVDIRAPVSASAWPVARIELQHGERGRVTDLASAPGALDAAFQAVSQIMGVPARAIGSASCRERVCQYV